MSPPPPAPSSGNDEATSLVTKWVERLTSTEYGQCHLVRLFLTSPSSSSPSALYQDETPLPPLATLLPTLLAPPSYTNFSSVGPFLSFCRFLEKLDVTLPSGGLLGYLKRARSLLQDAEIGANPFEGCSAAVPDGEILPSESQEFMDMEELGMSEIDKTAFVLVAGGLGERLGYDGIKISIPAECTSGMSFMEYYASYLKAFETVSSTQSTNGAPSTTTNGNPPPSSFSSRSIPLVLMTSDDTHKRTVEYFKEKKNFGLEKVGFVKQDKVPALATADGRVGVKASGKEGEVDEERHIWNGWEVELKPHGHGDVHTLLYQHGYLEKWVEEGRKWVVFFQDTNALVFRGIPASLGVSIKRQFAMNSIAVPRKPGEAVGGICKLSNPDGSSLTINVEYNLLDPLLRSNGGAGDVPDEKSGNSKYPGNINALIVHVPTYARVLAESKGVVPEFVNPKYKDDSRTEFKSSARLECMMQELPRLLPRTEKVGFTEMDRWMCYSAVKNSITDAVAKTSKAQPGECALSCESDMYLNNVRQLEMAHRYLFKNRGVRGGLTYLPQVGLSAPSDNPVKFQGVKSIMPVKVVLHPSWGVTRKQMCRHIVTNTKLCITDKSSLVLAGDVELGGLDLDGALILKAEEGAKLRVRDLTVVNKGTELEEISDMATASGHYTIRGYRLKTHYVEELRAKKDKEPLIVEGEYRQADTP